MTSLLVGVTTGWVPALWHNLGIRFSQDKILPRDIARGYRNHWHALGSIIKNDGFYPLVRSIGPLYAEQVAATVGLFTTMDLVKEKIRHAEYMGSAYP